MADIDFDLRQLEIFCKVVERSSFSKAAKDVHLAQASVSERIATLEKMIGTRLLDRLGRQVVPTNAGKLLHKHALLLLDMKKSACLEIENFLGLRKGEIHIGGSTIPGEYILPDILGPFRIEFPLVSVVLHIADSDDIRERVLTGDLEIGIVGSKGNDKNLIHHGLWHDELVLAVPANHKWSRKKSIFLKDLIREPFILREIGSGTQKIMEDYLRGAGIKGLESINVVARFGTSTAVKEGVKSGLGISILSERALQTELKHGMLKALKVKEIPMARTFYLIRDKRRTLSPLCRALMDYLKSTANQNKEAF